jgi:steroid delta-isomerase
MKDAVDNIVVFFETLTPHSVALLGQLYTDDAYFKDPFNEVRGLSAVQGVYSHMYRALENPRFVITARVVQADQCFLSWDFKFRFKSFDRQTEQTVRGGSHLLLAEDGRIRSHRDYWDVAEELYEKLPVLGSLMRWLKRRASR